MAGIVCLSVVLALLPVAVVLLRREARWAEAWLAEHARAAMADGALLDVQVRFVSSVPVLPTDGVMLYRDRR